MPVACPLRCSYVQTILAGLVPTRPRSCWRLAKRGRRLPCRAIPVGYGCRTLGTPPSPCREGAGVDALAPLSPWGRGRGWGWLPLPVRARPERRLRPVAQPQLAQYVRGVVLHAAFRDEQRLADLAVALAFRQQAQNLALALGQVVQRHSGAAAGRLWVCRRGRC